MEITNVLRLVVQAALREHLIANLGVSAEDLDPPSRPSGGRLKMEIIDGGMGSGDSVQDYEDDDQQVVGT